MTDECRTRTEGPARSRRVAALVTAGLLFTSCSSGSDTEDAASSASEDETSIEEGLEALPDADPAADGESTFPTVPGETEAVTVPTIELPTDSEATVDLAGTGETLREGDRVEIHYELRSLATGRLVESTRSDGAPRLVQIGEAMVPEVLEAALLGQQVGARLTVTYEQGLADLPADLDAADAYVLDVEIVSVS